MTETLFTRIRHPVVLEKKIASGGEGEVWQTNQIDVLAKVFYEPSSTRLEKLQTMIQRPPKDPMGGRGHVSIPWPQELLFKANGKFVGYLMPRVSGGLTLNNVSNAKLRNKKAPGFNWYYLHVAALNTASIVDALHARGYTIGDIKTDNFLINEKALVSVIDTDSFQVQGMSRIFRCGVASDGFTPPELIGKDMRRINRVPEHDRFGLAVIVYMLLTGDHPFSGQWVEGREPLSREEAIVSGIWPYGSQTLLRLSPLAVSLDEVPEKIRDAFLKTFNQGHRDPSQRVSAKQWCQLLSEALPQLKKCSKNGNHYTYDFKHKCTWCARSDKVGYDAFPTLQQASNFDLVQAFEDAAKKHDYRKMGVLWEQSPEIQQEEKLASYREKMTRLMTDLKKLDAFKDLCLKPGTSPDVILKVWKENPTLHVFSAHPGEHINGKPLQAFLTSLQVIDREKEHLIKVVEACDQRFQAKKAYVDDEKQIGTLFDALKKKEVVSEADQELVQRVKVSKKRLRAWADFKSLWHGDDFDLFQWFQANKEWVEGFLQAQEVHDRLKGMESHAKIYKIFEKKILNKEAFLDLLKAWEAYPRFHESRFATDLLVEGESVKAHVARAREKGEILKAFQAAEKNNTLYQAADLWTDALCDGEDIFEPYKNKVLRFSREKYEWTRLRAAALEDEDAYVVENWSESYASVAYKENLAEKIQGCFREILYKEDRVHHSGLERVFEHRDYWEIVFPWPIENQKEGSGARVSHLIFASHTKKFPETPNASETTQLCQVVKRPHIYSKFVTVFFPKVFKQQFFSVFPGYEVCGRVIDVGMPRHFKAPMPFPEVKYVFFTEKRGADTVLFLQLFSSESFILPAVSIQSHPERPLSFLDENGVVLTELGEVACKKGETLLQLKFTEEHAFYPYASLFFQDCSFYDKIRLVNLNTEALHNV